MSTIFKLIIEDDEGKTTVYPLVDGEVSIGRKEGNTIRLMERNVSRRHARLVREDDVVYLEDLDSYNGVRINGERIASRFRVREGDLIEIGDYHLALQHAAAEADAEATEDTQVLGDENDTHDSQEGDAGWPAGTVPDFRLPNDLLGDAQLPRDLGSPTGGPRDTIMDGPQGGPTDPAAGLESSASVPHLSERPTDRPAEGAGEPLVRAPRGGGLPPFPARPDAAPAEVLTPRPARRAEALVREPAEEQATRQLNRGPVHVSEVPRLVCVSTQYAGQEFLLDRDELIIGRVEDNDIVIEHRSVSRNHAKVRFDGRTHRIIDLQSANGILVNGEEYAMTNLRSGDLIELGNVRFRFVPAGEPFEATGEEAREMRGNGIEPPGADEGEAHAAPARASAYDPSTAATITDAPRSALPEVPAPQVEALAGAAPVGRVNGEVTREVSASLHRQTIPDDRAATRMDAPPRVASTANTAVIGTSGLPPGEAEERASFEPPPPSSPSYRPMMFALIGVLGVLVSVLAFLFLTRGDPAFDRRLEELYNQGNYAEVKTYYEVHEGEFADATKAAKLLGRAEARLEAPAAPPPEAGGEDAPPASPEPGAAASPEPAAATADALAADAPEPAAVEAPARTRSAPSKRSSRREASRNQARRLSRLGRDALIAGDMTRAERYLSECVDKAPGFAPCHRSLGVLYGHKKESARAVHHYQRYIELAPDAADADRFRSIIRDFESERAP